MNALTRAGHQKRPLSFGTRVGERRQQLDDLLRLLAGAGQGGVSCAGKDEGLEVAVPRCGFVGLGQMGAGGFPVPLVGENGSDQRIGPAGHPDLVLVGDDRLAHPRFKEGFVPLARDHQQRRELEVAARDLHGDRPLPCERYSGSHVRNGGTVRPAKYPSMPRVTSRSDSEPATSPGGWGSRS